MSNPIVVRVNGQTVDVPDGSTAAAAIAIAGESTFRKSVTGQPRGPLCGMGICFECQATINGRRGQRSCQTACQPDMTIETFYGPSQK